MHDFATGSFLVSLAACAGVVVALVLVTWLLGMAIGRYNVIDVAWGGFRHRGLGRVGDLRRSRRHHPPVPGRGAVTLWGGRLALHIVRRNWGKGEDPRYTEMLPTIETRRSALRIYLTQALVMWFVSLPVQVAMFEPAGRRPAHVGTAVWAVGFSFESVGDGSSRDSRPTRPSGR